MNRRKISSAADSGAIHFADNRIALRSREIFVQPDDIDEPTNLATPKINLRCNEMLAIFQSFVIFSRRRFLFDAK